MTFDIAANGWHGARPEAGIRTLDEADMAKPELGDKHTCASCGARFFDLGKEPAICPKCGTEQPIEPPKLKRAAPMPDEVKKPAKQAAEETEETDVDDAVDTGDDDILEDADEIDDSDEIDADIEVERDSEDTER